MGKTEMKCARCAERETEKKRARNGFKLLVALAGVSAGLIGFLMSTVTLVVGAAIEEPLWLASCFQYTTVLAILLEYILIVYGSLELVKWRPLK